MTDKKKTDETETPDNGPPEAEAEAEATESEAADEGTTEESTDVATQLAERTADLQRITAEYHNYRKRVERDKALAAEQAAAGVVTGLLPVLDDIDRARDHDDLEGPFASVAEQLLNALVKLGLEVFGEKGDPFDPSVHEAVAHMVSPEVTQTSCIDVMRRGYRLGDRLLRPAMVAVAEPAEADAAEGAEPGDSGEETVTEPKEFEKSEESTEPDVDLAGAVDQAQSEETTPDLDADVPPDEEQLKAEQVQDAVAEAGDTDAATPSKPIDEERPETELDKTAPDDTKKTENE